MIITVCIFKWLKFWILKRLLIEFWPVNLSINLLFLLLIVMLCLIFVLILKSLLKGLESQNFIRKYTPKINLYKSYCDAQFKSLKLFFSQIKMHQYKLESTNDLQNFFKNDLIFEIAWTILYLFIYRIYRIYRNFPALFTVSNFGR